MSDGHGNVWAMTDHVCLACLGRVLERFDRTLGAEAPRIFRCSNCGVEAVGGGPNSRPPICACNAKLGRRDAGIRCVANSRPRPELPSEFVAREIA